MEKVSRRNLLAAAGAGAAMATALVGTAAAQGSPTRPPGQPVDDWLGRYILVHNMAGGDSLRTPSSPNQPVTGPQYWTGTLWNDGDVAADGTPASGARQRGTWRAYVWVWAAGQNPGFDAVHTLDIAGKGVLTASGTTDRSVAVTGGTGDFQGARGEIRMNVLSPITVALELDLGVPNIGH